MLMLFVLQLRPLQELLLLLSSGGATGASNQATDSVGVKTCDHPNAIRLPTSPNPSVNVSQSLFNWSMKDRHMKFQLLGLEVQNNFQTIYSNVSTKQRTLIIKTWLVRKACSVLRNPG